MQGTSNVEVRHQSVRVSSKLNRAAVTSSDARDLISPLTTKAFVGNGPVLKFRAPY